MKRLCVFCGANPGGDATYRETARRVGTLLAERKIGVVFGGGKVGLMGAVADAALEAGGEVIGVIPQDLVDKELAHRKVPDLRIVRSMHERKALMEKLSDGFIALPGGFGTMDEFCEIVTWAQLGFHDKPCGMLNLGGYYDRFLAFLDHAVGQGFIAPDNRALILEAPTPESMLETLAAFRPKPRGRWVKSP
ncbi:MAG: TIGR00730 family Rossman fold protein [Elusimicrobia bacterium]|nr:TIGR00730 family Rossman fold protein [Elusimicrobiota bacterium]